MTEAVVYTAWDADDWCLYVGCTSNLSLRMRQHAYTSDWHRYMARLDTSEPLPLADARQLERYTIDVLRPQFNREHNGYVVAYSREEYDMAECIAAERGDWKAAADALACMDACGPFGCGAVPLTDVDGYRAFVAERVNASTCRAYGLDDVAA